MKRIPQVTILSAAALVASSATASAEPISGAIIANAGIVQAGGVGGFLATLAVNAALSAGIPLLPSRMIP